MGGQDISIHAARVGCDRNASQYRKAGKHFNPRSPSGLRQDGDGIPDALDEISIHAARVGCDIFTKFLDNVPK